MLTMVEWLSALQLQTGTRGRSQLHVYLGLEPDMQQRILRLVVVNFEALLLYEKLEEANFLNYDKFRGIINSTEASTPT